MRIPMILIGLAAAASVHASAYFTSVTNSWYAGRQTNVLALANARLASNTNDIAGLLMKASYEFDFADATTLSNTLARVLSVGPTVATPAFTNAFQLTRIDILGTFDTLATETAEERAADQHKVEGPGHPMAYEDELTALERDGYFQE